MQSASQVPPDFSIGYGSELEEQGVNLAALVVFALVIAVVVYLVQRKGKKR